MSEVTKRIDLVLKERGISKQSFYEECSITSAAYSQWNTGKTTPRGSTLRRVAEYLHVDYLWLSTGSTQTENTLVPKGEEYSEKERAIIDAYRNKPEFQSAVDVLLGLKGE